MNTSPPKWADKFLQWYCNPNLLEEIQGDAYELYERRMKEEGKKIADRKYKWDVFRFFRWSNIIRTQNKYQHSNNLPMLKNYIKVGFRNLSKHWVTSGINILGLAIAIGCAITTFIFIDNQLNMDSFHKNKDNIYQVINHVQNGENTEPWGDSPIKLGPVLKEKYPTIDKIARVEYQRASMRYQDNVFNELIMFVDPSYIQMFDFPMRYGDESSLNNKENIVIGNHIADKYFGEENPIGKRISVKYASGKTQSYFIGGVIEKLPHNSSLRPSILIPMTNFFDLKLKDNYGWDYLTDATFISIKSGSSIEDFDMTEFQNLHNEANAKWTIKRFEFISLNELSQRGYEIIGSMTLGGHPAGRLALGVIALFLLLLACFNYMNIAVASATKRLKEIAMRKVMGSTRRNIINQFLMENIILCAFALLIGALLSFFFFLPGFDMMIPVMEFPFEFSSLCTMIGLFAGLLLLIGLASGAYPALYISKFEPVHIFKGNQKFGNKSFFSRTLLVFQLFFAISTVVACFVFTDNAMYMSSRGWGYNPEGIISIPVNNQSEFETLKTEALKNPSIKIAAGSYGHVAVYDPMTTLDYLGKQFTIIRYKTSKNYLNTTGLRLKEGRFFEQENEINSMVVNEKFVQEMGWENPLNETIKYDSIRRNIIGVVEDFHYEFFYTDIHPVIFIAGESKEFNYLTIKTNPADELEVDKYLSTAWSTIAPNDPYNRNFQSDVFDEAYRENRANIYLILTISGIAILLACLGLFGLLSFNLQKRMKEYGVRKVLGASAMHIVKLANKEYSWILIISFVLGAPIGYFFINSLMSQIYADPKPANALPFIIAMIIITLTFAITISTQIWKATKVNPTEILRSE